MRILSAGIALAACLTMAACTATPAVTTPGVTTPSPTESSATPEPSGGTSAIPISDDTVLAIDAIATASNGAQLDISVRVHRSQDAERAGALREQLLGECGPDFVTPKLLDGKDWGLVRIHTAARAIGEVSWPADEPISLVTAPRGEPRAAAITSSGPPLVTLKDPAGELGPCLVPPHLNGAGEAYAVLGIGHDFASDTLEGVFWNGYRFGVSNLVFNAANDVRLSDCVIRKTALGDELAAPEIGYSEVSSAAECSAGIPPAS